MGDQDDFLVELAYYLSYCFSEMQNGSLFTSTRPSMTDCITFTILSLIHSALGEVSNDTMDLLIDICHHEFFKKEFEKTWND